MLFRTFCTDSCLLAISETWLSKLDSEKELSVDGFSGSFRVDCNSGITCKTWGKGCVMWTSTGAWLLSWERSYAPRTLRCLWYPFGHIICLESLPKYLCLWYIFTQRRMWTCLWTILRRVLWNTISECSNFHYGDFSNCVLEKCVKNMYGYVTCPTRHKRNLDQFYGSYQGSIQSFFASSFEFVRS